MADGARWLARRAWIAGRWQDDVLLEAGADGCWSRIEIGSVDAGTATRVAGCVVPGLVNAHSHAFQRAIAGLTERAAPGRDDFWSWRDRMYRVALTVTPAQVEAIATTLYRELLAGGFTHVCEFHYLHNDIDGRPYADAAEMSLALARAAQAAGIGLTLLPTLYMRAGFGTEGLREDQRRFASTPDSVLRIAERVNALSKGNPLLRAGVALHSLRAVDEGALRETARAAKAAGLPVHIHIEEQPQEVEDCLRAHGARPIDRLLAQVEVDARWNLVHATHASEPSLRALHATGASVVLCPTTEANLGDGLFDFGTWASLRGRWSIGTDSHVNRAWPEELRLLEYGQRLVRRERNVASRLMGVAGTGDALLSGGLSGASAAAGLPMDGLAVGARADWAVLPVEGEAPLDTALFSTPAASPRVGAVAGRAVSA